MLKLSIVIPVFNKFAFTKSCLKDLSHLPNDHQVIIIDNASTDETQKMLEGSTEVVYYRNLKNEGFGRASNIGYSLATAPNVLFLNNDIRVKANHSSWTEELIKWCPYGLVGPTMGQLDKDFNFIKEANQYLTGNSYMSGWCLASSKEIFNKLEIPRTESENIDELPVPHILQIFDERFFVYHEDTDLSLRARKSNIEMKVVEIPVVHFGKQSSQQLNVHKLYTESKKIFINKWKK